jgi:hypothetical protein
MPIEETLPERLLGFPTWSGQIDPLPPLVPSRIESLPSEPVGMDLSDEEREMVLAFRRHQSRSAPGAFRWHPKRDNFHVTLPLSLRLPANRNPHEPVAVEELTRESKEVRHEDHL